MALNLSPQPSSKKNLGSLIELRKNSLQFSLTEVFLLIVLIGLFSWFLVLPKWDAYALQKEKSIQLTEDKNKIEGQASDLKDSIQVMEKNKESFSKLDEALPLNTYPTTLYILFDEMTQTADVVIRNLSIDDRQDRVFASDKEMQKNPYKIPRNVKKVSGSLEASGDFAKLQAFLEKIEKTNRLIKVTSVEYEREQGDKLLMRIIFETYSYE